VKYLLIALVLICMLPGCSSVTKEMNSFSATNDTLVIRTQKQKGQGLFMIGAVNPDFKDPADKSFTYPVTFSTQIENITRLQLLTEFVHENKNYIDILKGTKDNEEVFIVDKNNNHDFTDDAIHPIKELIWDRSDHLAKTTFLISNGQKIVRDSAWVELGIYDNTLFFRKNEHLTADITLGKKQYKIGIADPRSPAVFSYSNTTEIALLNDNGKLKDKIVLKDNLKLGEYIRLNNTFYRFENISNNGEYITLIKDKDFDKKTGLQIGMNAPGFKGVTIAGAIVNSADLHNKITIILNSCECGGDKESTEAYYEIREKYGDKINLLRLDSDIRKDLDGLQINVSAKENKELYDSYRGEYCSRTCYIIDKNNKLVDKFESHKWKQYLDEKTIQ